MYSASMETACSSGRKENNVPRIHLTHRSSIIEPLCLALMAMLACMMLGGHAHAGRPVIKAVIVERAPEIDGDLSDACWASSPSVEDFYYPNDGSKAPEPTTAWLCYDDECIYMAFRCGDSQPEKIIAQQKKRGGDLGSDDWVGFDLDCYGDFKKICWFDLSAGGVQVESLQTGDASKIEWKGDWKGKVKRTEDGYTAEMAIPFSILQYDPNQTKMGIAFIRQHGRLQRWWWSPDVGPNTEATRFYAWEGLKLPKRTNRPIILGYSLLGTGGDDPPRRAGLDIRHAITPSLNGLVTVNPDFRSIEQQVDSVDFSYTERYLADSRPFFLEGPKYFPESNILYTRRIEEVDTGLKLSGRVGDYDLGFMHTQQFGDENHTVLQMAHHWADRTSLWLCGMTSSVPGLDNAVTMSSFRHTLRKSGPREIRFASAYSTATSRSGPGTGKRYYSRFYTMGKPRQVQWEAKYETVDADYDPYLGLVGEKDRKTLSLNLSMSDAPSDSRVHEWYTSLNIETTDHHDGSLYHRGGNVYGDLMWRNGTGCWVSGALSDRPPYNDSTVRVGYYWDENDLYKHGGISVGGGRLAGGDYRYWSINQGWPINDRLSLRASYEVAQIKAPSPDAFSSHQAILSAAYDLDNERTIGGRLINREGKMNMYLAFKQRVSAGTDAYLIYGDPNAEETASRLTLKLVRPL